MSVFPTCPNAVALVIMRKLISKIIVQQIDIILDVISSKHYHISFSVYNTCTIVKLWGTYLCDLSERQNIIRSVVMKH